MVIGEENEVKRGLFIFFDKQVFDDLYCFIDETAEGCGFRTSIHFALMPGFTWLFPWWVSSWPYDFSLYAPC